MSSPDQPLAAASASDQTSEQTDDPRFGERESGSGSALRDGSQASSSPPPASLASDQQASPSSSGETPPRSKADAESQLSPLVMSECPACGAREFVSRKLVYEELDYKEDGSLDACTQRVRAELELACADCGQRFRKLPVNCRTFYSEVQVLQEDLHAAIKRTLRLWATRVRRRLPLV